MQLHLTYMFLYIMYTNKDNVIMGHMVGTCCLKSHRSNILSEIKACFLCNDHSFRCVQQPFCNPPSRFFIGPPSSQSVEIGVKYPEIFPFHLQLTSVHANSGFILEKNSFRLKLAIGGLTQNIRWLWGDVAVKRLIPPSPTYRNNPALSFL